MKFTYYLNKTFDVLFKVKFLNLEFSKIFQVPVKRSLMISIIHRIASVTVYVHKFTIILFHGINLKSLEL